MNSKPRAKCERGKAMTIDRIVIMFAGFMVLLSLVLGYYFSPYWNLLAAVVGLNLIQASITGFCPFATLLKRFGVKPGEAFN